MDKDVKPKKRPVNQSNKSAFGSAKTEPKTQVKSKKLNNDCTNTRNTLANQSTNFTTTGTLNNYNTLVQDQVENTSTSNNYNINECGEEEINEIIRRNAEAKKQYSKTCSEQIYTPLSYSEKIKFLKDMNVNTDNRLKLYSELFKEIKTQICGISASFIKNNITKDKSVGLYKNVNLTGKMNHIDEEENEVMDFSVELENKNEIRTIKKKNIIKIDNTKLLPKNHFSIESNCIVDEENIQSIVIPCKEYRRNDLHDVDFYSSRKQFSYSFTENNSRNMTTQAKINALISARSSIRGSNNIKNNVKVDAIPKSIHNTITQTKNFSFKNNDVMNSFFVAKRELQSYTNNAKKLENGEVQYPTANSCSYLNSEDLKMSMHTIANQGDVDDTETDKNKLKCTVF